MRVIRTVCGCRSFTSLLGSIPLGEHSTHYTFSVDGRLWSFQLRAVMNNTALNFRFMAFGGHMHALLLCHNKG